jgi:hypothetical protein
MEPERIDQLNKEALQLLGFEKAPDDFTARIMEQIEKERFPVQSAYFQVIGKKGWIAIAAFSAFFILGLWFASQPGIEDGGLISSIALKNFWSDYIYPFASALVSASNSLKIFLLGVITATMLLLLDMFFGEKIKQLKTGQ